MAAKVVLVNGVLKTRPVLSPEEVIRSVEECFGLEVDCNFVPIEKESFEDRNFVLQGKLKPRGKATDQIYEQFHKFVLKIYNGSETSYTDWYEIVNSNLLTIQENCRQEFRVPYPIRNIDGKILVVREVDLPGDVTFENCTCRELLDGGFIRKKDATSKRNDGIKFNQENSYNLTSHLENDENLQENVEPRNSAYVIQKTSDGSKNVHELKQQTVDRRYSVMHLFRLTAYIEGDTLKHGCGMNESLAYSWGRVTASLLLAMEKLPQPKNNDRERWIVHCAQYPDILRQPYISSIQDDSLRAQLLDFVDKFKVNVLPQLSSLPGKQWIHGDMADHNILIGCESVDQMAKKVIENDGGKSVTGVIDFDDATFSYRIIDFALAFLDLVSLKDRKMGLLHGRSFVSGVKSLIKLTDQEKFLLYDFILFYFVRNIANVNFQAVEVQPGNKYVIELQHNVLDAFQFVLHLGRDQFYTEIELLTT